ncbi:MAG: class I SAM-dependent methyltransferase [Gemmatimonadales bacterium]
MLSPAAVRHFYDRFGARQDRQGFYEDPALDDLLAHADLSSARRIVEFGCGTGRLAARLLQQAPSAAYIGWDVSTTMVRLARDRLGPLGRRAQVHLLDPGAVQLPIPDHAADRFVSTYVLDLLSPEDIHAVLREARRVLQPGGRLCVASLAAGSTAVSRLVSGLWTLVFRLRPQLVGGCRPIALAPYCAGSSWEVLHQRVVRSWGISSEVLVARPADAAG